MEVLHSSSYGGFDLAQPTLLEIFKRHPELFPISDKKEPEEPDSFLKDRRGGGHLRDPEGNVRRVWVHHIDTPRLRSDRRIVDVVKEIGLEASRTKYCQPAIAVVPLGYDYEIEEYDGSESIRVVFPYKEVIADLLDFYRTGNKQFKSKFTQKVIDGEIEASNDFLPKDEN